MDEKSNQLLTEYIDKLNTVKEEFIRLKKEQLVSVRKDYVKTELKDILLNTTSYEELQQSLQKYIDNLL